MSKINLEIDFTAVVERIDVFKDGLKPAEWAKLVKVSQNVVSNVHGAVKQKPSLEYIVAVAKACNVGVDYLLWGDERQRFYVPNDRNLEFLRMAAYVLSSDNAETASTLEANIAIFHKVVLRESGKKETEE